MIDPKFTSAVELMSYLESQATDYMQLRKNQVKSIARLRATAIAQTLMYPFIDEHTSNIDAAYLKDQLSIDWLSSVMVSVQPDSEKVLEATDFVRNAAREKINKKQLDELVTQLIAYLKEDFNSMRSLKQTIYYRTRSINAVTTFFNSLSSQEKKYIFSNSEDISSFLTSLKQNYLTSGDLPKHTKNSYLGEFFSYVADLHPEIVPLEDNSSSKSLDHKSSQNLANFADLASQNKVIESAYEDLMKLMPSADSESTNQATPSSSQNQGVVSSSITLSVRKDEGIFFTYTPTSGSLKDIINLSDGLLVSAMTISNMPDIDIQVIERPSAALLVKCKEGTLPAQLKVLRKAIEDLI